jgi:hypothetical protein
VDDAHNDVVPGTAPETALAGFEGGAMMAHGLSGKPIAKLTLSVTVVDEGGELFWETESKTELLSRRAGDVRRYEPQLIEEGIEALYGLKRNA